MSLLTLNMCIPPRWEDSHNLDENTLLIRLSITSSQPDHPPVEKRYVPFLLSIVTLPQNEASKYSAAASNKSFPQCGALNISKSSLLGIHHHLYIYSLFLSRFSKLSAKLSSRFSHRAPFSLSGSFNIAK